MSNNDIPPLKFKDPDEIEQFVNDFNRLLKKYFITTIPKPKPKPKRTPNPQNYGAVSIMKCRKKYDILNEDNPKYIITLKVINSIFFNNNMQHIDKLTEFVNIPRDVITSNNDNILKDLHDDIFSENCFTKKELYYGRNRNKLFNILKLMITHTGYTIKKHKKSVYKDDPKYYYTIILLNE